MWYSIDGITWDYPCDVERTSELKLDNTSGMLLDRTIYNSVLGTYPRFTIKCIVPPSEMDAYYQIRAKLTEPVGEHTFVLPYDGGTITIIGSVESLRDVYVKKYGQIFWTGIQFEVKSTVPERELSYGQILARGRSPLPETAAVGVGDIYEYTSAGWQPLSYEDADNKYY